MQKKHYELSKRTLKSIRKSYLPLKEPLQKALGVKYVQTSYAQVARAGKVLSRKPEMHPDGLRMP